MKYINKNIDKKRIQVISLTNSVSDRDYWLSKTPQERINHIEVLRRINYGDKATQRLQRVLEVVELGTLD